MGWICMKKMKVKRGGVYVTLNPGEPVPEATSWRNPKAWARQKFIRWIDRDLPLPSGTPSVSVEKIKSLPIPKRDSEETTPILEPPLEVEPEKVQPKREEGKKKRRR